MRRRLKSLDWDQLRIFHAVGEAGSFTKAGRKLQLSQSAVSRQIHSLEKSLAGPLFYRHARGLVLTEQGEEFFRAVQAMEATLAQGLSRITESRDQPEGPLKITTTVTFGSAWLTSRITRFHQQYPGIAVSLVLVDSTQLDLLTRQADVAIRFAEPSHAKLIKRKLMNIRYHLYASRSYLSKRGVPRTVRDLDRHELIVYGDDMQAPLKNFDWILEVGVEDGRMRKPALRVNSIYGIYRAARSGLGIAALPYYISDESHDLVQVLPEVLGPSIDAFFVYPEELRWSKRVAVLRDFLLREAVEDPGAASGAQAAESRLAAGKA